MSKIQFRNCRHSSGVHRKANTESCTRCIKLPRGDASCGSLMGEGVPELLVLAFRRGKTQLGLARHRAPATRQGNRL